MKIVLPIFAVLLGLIPLSTCAQPSSSTELIAAYRAAIEEKSGEKLNAITYMVGMSEADKTQMTFLQQMIFSNDGDANKKIVAISLVPLPADVQLVNIVNGKRWEPTYSPVGLIQIQYGGTANGMSSSSQAYAIIGGHYYLVSTKSTDLGWKGPPDKTLGFMVMGQGQNKVEIAVTWNVSGVEQERTFKGTSNMAFLGQYVEKVAVTSTDDDTDVTLTISDTGKEIYHSQPLKGKGTIEYKKS